MRRFAHAEHVRVVAMPTTTIGSDHCIDDTNGGGFVTVAMQAGREYAGQTLRSAYGKKFTFTATGRSYETDPGHMEKVIHERGLSDSKRAATLGVRGESTVGRGPLGA